MRVWEWALEVPCVAGVVVGLGKQWCVDGVRVDCYSSSRRIAGEAEISPVQAGKGWVDPNTPRKPRKIAVQ